MKKILLTLVLMVGVVLGLFAQKLTYQAVIRDNNQQLVVNTAVKATVTITFTTGTPTTYSEEVNATTNLHGLLSIEFGDGSLVGRDWTDATIAVKVVNSATSSIVYVNDEPRPVSAVPYALSVNGVAIQQYLTEHHYVDQTELDNRHYLTSDSTVITTMQGNIIANATNITSLQSGLSAAISKEKTDSTTLAGRIDALEGAAMDCNKVKDCIKDTLSKYTVTDQLCNVVNNCDLSANASLNTLLNAINAKIDSLAHVVDSLAKLPHGGGEVADGQPCPGAAKVTDYDNIEYNTVKIGNQCWMKENLKTTHYANGTPISYGGSYTSTTNAYLYYPNGKSDNVSTYGYLYNWKAVMDTSSSSEANPSGVQGICPTGWHVPSDAEWTQLTEYVKSKAEYKCGDGADNIANALSSPTGWQSPSECGAGHNSTTLNKTGFSAVPAGGCFNGFPSSFGSTAYFWSATQCGGTPAWYRYLSSDASNVTSYFANKDSGLAVRCLRDAGTGGGGTPTVFTCGTSTVKDVDDNEYNTVKIGSQCWTKENLKTTTTIGNTYNPGPNSSSTNEQNASNVATYGLLYDWTAVMQGASSSDAVPSGVQGICPAGWHVPSAAEWDTLTKYTFENYECGGDCGSWAAGNEVRCIANALSSTTGWISNNTEGCRAGNTGNMSNATGFSALPAGYYYSDSGYSTDLGYNTCFWSTNHTSEGIMVNCRELHQTHGSMNCVNKKDSYGCSVRCLKD